MRGICAITLICLLTACSGKKDFPEDQLKKFVAAHDVSLIFDVGRVGRGFECGNTGYSPAELIEYVAAEKAGYITIKPAGNNLWDVQLTDAGESMLQKLKKKHHTHETKNNCDYEVVSYPLAAKSFVQLKGSSKNGDTLEGDYMWKWVPTEAGTQLAKLGLTDAQVADLKHALGYQVYEEDYFTFPIDENATHEAKQAFQKKNDRWVLVVQ
jgi:hypothetical protein